MGRGREATGKPPLAGPTQVVLGSSSLHGFNEFSPHLFSPPPGQMPGGHLFTGPCEAGETWGAGAQVLVDKPANVAVPLAFGLSLPARP